MNTLSDKSGGLTTSARAAEDRLLRYAKGEPLGRVYASDPCKLDALRRDVRALHNLMVTWRSTAQRWTPGGSEFMDPAFCVQFIRDRQMLHHQERLELHKARKKLAALKAEAPDNAR